MQVLGSSKVLMNTKSKPITTEALEVTTNLAHPVLLSWHDLIRLKVIDEHFPQTANSLIWSEWRLTVIAATVRIALVDILDLSEVVIPAGVFLHPAVGWG